MENQNTDRKSLRLIIGKAADWNALARDCVCFANGEGGRLLIGIEDGESLPAVGQVVPVGLLDTVRRRIAELTVNVHALPQLEIAENGGQYVQIFIARSAGVASTSDGRYFLRVGDSCQPVLGDDVLRLADERPGIAWEAMKTSVAGAAADSSKLVALVAGIRASDRVKGSVKEKNDRELLNHYGLVDGDVLTHLGVLLIGTQGDRMRLGTAPLVQAIRFDELGTKVNKWLWDDYTLSPLELVDAVWREVTDFRESYEVAEGLYRRNVPAYDEKVVRELLVNALVHRPYTQRGDIFLNLHPDRLEVVNPGRLPLGVTPRNVLHASRRRNEGLARIFHDLGLMEKEGSGFDLMYDRLLSFGRPAPVLTEGIDWVMVTVQRRIVRPEIVRLTEEADRQFQLTQRERITVGVLAQTEGVTARELVMALELDSPDMLKSWLGRLPSLDMVRTSGRSRATRYFVNPDRLRSADVPVRTSLVRIEPHRLQALIREDLLRYPWSSSGEIRARIGNEIGYSTIKLVLDNLVKAGEAESKGERRWRRYCLKGAE